MLLRFGVLFAFASTLLIAGQRKPASNCCLSNAQELSPKQVKALLDKTEPIQPPCCSGRLRLKGTVVFAITVDAKGDVTCIETLSGHPLIIGSVLDSIRRWKFRPYVSRGMKKQFCGRLALNFEATEYKVKYKVIQASLN
jgi:outer membrane biosynthesis protein TonB